MEDMNEKYFYSKEAPKYDQKRWSSRVGQYIDQTQKDIVRAMLPDVSGRKILEIGGGTGRFSLLLAMLGGEITALDVSREMLNIIKRKAEEANLSEKISMVQADASQKIPFSNETFDFCIAINTLSHIKNPNNLLEEVHRVLKPKGIFLSNYPNLTSCYFPFGIIVNLRERSFWNEVFTKWYSLPEIKKLYKKNGFSVTMVKGEFFLVLNINNKVILELLKLVDRSFRDTLLKYIAPIVFIKSIKSNKRYEGSPNK